jgi:16S rRNA (guanine966-N2)-methyltransferase
VREALFSSLGEQVVGARVLDLFAGTGSYGIEAWSRGAASVCWVEKDRQVMRILRDNVETLCGSDSSALQVCSSDAERFLERDAHREGPFDLVVADPPYGQPGDENGWLEKLLRIVGGAPILAVNGRFVMEQGGREAVVESPGWELLKDKTYGGTRLLQYGLKAPANQRGVPI